MNSVEQLRDIHGLDPLPFWPFGLGTWIFLGGLLVGMVLLFVFYRRSRIQKPIDWSQVALNEWKTLSPQPHHLHAQIEQLSMLLKRVAMQRYGRETCAGLSGMPWLAWVAQHDSNPFDWVQQGRILIELPYMPPEAPIDIEQVKIIYQAIGNWIEQAFKEC